jgi:hypothetical protein
MPKKPPEWVLPPLPSSPQWEPSGWRMDKSQIEEVRKYCEAQGMDYQAAVYQGVELWLRIMREKFGK